MDFDLAEDHALLAQTLDRWAADHAQIPAGHRSATYLPGETLAEELAQQGYYDIAAQEAFGLPGAVLLIEAIGRTPFAIELGGSALVAPLLGLSDLARPLALISPAGGNVARFLAKDGAALVDAGDHVRLLQCGSRVQPVANPYAYPFGRFEGDMLAASRPLPGVSVGAFRSLCRLASTAEAVAAMAAALDVTIEYVKARVQFGRPIGSFQAVQHRLAECSVLLHGARLLLHRAATDATTEHVAQAALVTHDAIKRVLYETNQFHGAIGLTLEYRLHLWTYRLRILQCELAAGMDAP